MRKNPIDRNTGEVWTSHGFMVLLSDLAIKKLLLC